MKKMKCKSRSCFYRLFMSGQENRWKSYNKKVKKKSFQIEDFVWKVILPMNKKSKNLVKWSPNWDWPYVIEKVLSGNAYAIQEVNTDRYIGSINGKYLKIYRPMITEINIPLT